MLHLCVHLTVVYVVQRQVTVMHVSMKLECVLSVCTVLM